MKARTFKFVENGVYKVSIYTEDWSEHDVGLMVKYSEPEMDVGGDFTGAVTFELPNRLVRIRNESPFTVSFDSRDSAEAEDRADVWALTVLARLDTAVTTLRANVDEFSSESVTNI